MLRFSKVAIALSVFLPGVAIQVAQQTVAVAQERLDAHAAQNSGAHASRDEVCHVYKDRFINAVVARQKASSRENDADSQQSLHRLDAKIAAANERLAEECGG
jgi:flagellar motility protein MotE (MotC chaperone)